MNVRSSYIPKSRKASEIARLLDRKVKDVRGRYVMNVIDPTPEQARQIAYILDPEYAASEEDRAIAIAQAALDNPAAYGWTIEQSEKYYGEIIAGWWALGR